ncbi:TIGR02452 family protein [Lacticaseibacillus baoqingensis]|uniref:TIGR02452 family protein n=1 Tax=Lacticaseibacillus baoqingensis TaxID=2486013 RepID=A0ABW4E4U5_9LACO|nr:TIGR02452 family protein [Lacticaseibacillus baoqingensis]
MNQIRMFRETMAAFKADQDWPQSTLITDPLPETAPKGKDFAPWSVINQDVLAVMSQFPQGVGVMNFASPNNPGGGVEYGAKAQEESIAKATYLVPALRQFESSYYAPNRADPNGGLNTPHLIYSSHVRQVFDDQAQRLTDRYLDIVTVAAPNRRRFPDLDADVAQADIDAKILQTLRAFKAHDVAIPILGAFGAGVFGNPVAPVATSFATALLRPEFAGAWTRVVFAVYSPDDEFYQQFVTALKGASHATAHPTTH